MNHVSIILKYTNITDTLIEMSRLWTTDMETETRQTAPCLNQMQSRSSMALSTSYYVDLLVRSVCSTANSVSGPR